MLRRFIAVFSVLAILIAVCVPAFAAPTEVNIWEYADIQVDGTTKVVTINLPTSWLKTSIFNSGWGELYSQTGNNSAFDLSNVDFSNGNLYVGFFPLGTAYNPYANVAYSGRCLDVSDLPNGSIITFSVRAEIQNASSESSNVFGSRFGVGQVLNNGDNMKNTLVSTALSGNFPVYSSYHEYVLSDNSVPLIFNQFFLITSSEPASRWLFSLEYFTISTSIDALQQLVDATGETNKLLDEVNKKLDEITDRPPDPTTPSWGESAGDAEEKEDQIIDQLDPDQVTNDLADMHLTLVDNLLLYTNAFAAISAIWVVLIDLPFIKIILYCSLLFGLLAAFLGMGLAAGRASDRHSGRTSGKKGK